MRFFSTLIASTLGALLAISLFLFFGFVFIFAIAMSAETTPTVRPGSVLVFDLSGSVPERVAGDPFAQALGLEAPFGMWDATEAIRKAASDSRVEALWLRMRVSTISWPIASEIRRAVERFKESGKPVYASAEDYPVTENAYYIASVADSIFAGPGSFVEFNGFYILSEFYKGLLDKLDVQPQVVRVGEYKSAVEPFERTSLSGENREQLDAILATQEDTFVEAIASSRGMSADEVRGTMTRFGIGTATDALDAGLLDGIRYYDEVVSMLKSAAGTAPERDLPTVRMAEYVRVPSRSAGITTSGDSEIAVIYMHGPILSGSSRSPGVLTPASVRSALKRASESDRVKAVVVRIDSPGGSAPAADAILRDIRETAAVKPMYVSMGSMAASGGYWIAMAADTIVADPVTLTGSIGVFSVFFDVGDLYEDKLGITHEVRRTNPQADMLSGLRPLTPVERARMQSSVDETYASFLRVVADNREMEVEQVDRLARGRVWSGADAREVGLVDALGGLGDTIELAADAVGLVPGGYRVRFWPAPTTFLDRLNSTFGATMARLGFSPLSHFERSILDRARLVESLVSESGTVQARLPFDVTMQ